MFLKYFEIRKLDEIVSDLADSPIVRCAQVEIRAEICLCSKNPKQIKETGSFTFTIYFICAYL